MSEKALKILKNLEINVEIDCIYYKENHKYYEELKENGYIIFEFPTCNKGLIRIKRLK